MQEDESPKKDSKLKNIQNLLKKELKEINSGNGLHKWINNIVVSFTNLKKIRDVSKNNYELGKKHYNLGNFDDAIMRFKLVTWLESKNASGWYWLGASYLAMHKKPKACDALKKAIELKPDLEKAREMLKVARSADKS